MNHSSHEKGEAFLLSLADIKYLLRKWKSTIVRGALVCAALALLLVLLSPVKYTSEATFYEKAKSDGVNKNNKNSAALLLLGEERESSAIVMLKSDKIVEEAIKKLNLQVTVRPYTLVPRIVTKIFKGLINNPPNNISAQWAHLSRSVYPLEFHDPSELIVKGVVYDREVPLDLDIRFLSSQAFTVKNSKGIMLGEGQLGLPFNHEDIRFILEANQPLDFNQRRYELAFMPSRKMAEEISSNLKVVSDYKDKSFITLTLTYDTRQGTSALLNAIMDAYQQYLADEHHRVVASQVAYLKERRAAMEGHLASLMHEHAEQLSNHAGNLDLLIATQQNLQKKLLTTDLEIKHIQQAMGKGSYLQAHYISESDPPFVHQTVAEIRGLRQQSRARQLALNDLPKSDQFKETGQEFQGIDLETANTLYISYCRELQEAEANAIQNQYVIDKVRQPTFELTSLASVLTDPVSSEIVKKASSLALAMKDQGNRTQRELERLNQDLDLQRSFLTQHLQQIVELLKLRAALLYAKIQAVQEASLELLQQKISLHEQQLLDYASSRLNSLQQERELIQHQKQALQQEFEKLPAQWASEKLVDLYLTADGALMEHLGSLIESKNIADHLEISLSAPFDYGISPLHPKSPHLILFGLLGALIGAFGVTCFALMQSAMRGIDVTVENLRLAGGYVAGSLSGKVQSKDNLETLRHLTAHLCPADESKHDGRGGGRSLLILESKGPRYASELAALLGKRQLKVLIVEISFDQQEKMDGLLGYLEGTSKNLNLQRKENYDLLPAGGISDYGAELIESVAYRQLLQELLSKYDWILAVSRASPCSAEAEGALALFDRAAITVTDEKLHELEGYLALSKPCAFVVSKCPESGESIYVPKSFAPKPEKS